MTGFTRPEWDCDRNLSDPESFFLGGETVRIKTIGAQSGTASVVMRLRKAHPPLARTKQDVVV